MFIKKTLPWECAYQRDLAVFLYRHFSKSSWLPSKAQMTPSGSFDRYSLLKGTDLQDPTYISPLFLNLFILRETKN